MFSKLPLIKPKFTKSMTAVRDIPHSLILNGRLVLHDIYRTAKFSEERSALVRAKVSDQFPYIIPNDPWDGSGVHTYNQTPRRNETRSKDECFYGIKSDVSIDQYIHTYTHTIFFL